MKINDLIYGKYYKTLAFRHYCFRFDKIEDSKIKTFGYFLINYRFKLSNVNLLLNNLEFEEIELDSIVYYFPETHIEHINYIRKQKINYLLTL